MSDFKIISLQPLHHVRTFLGNPADIRASIKAAINAGSISLQEVDEEGDVIEQPIKIDLAKVVAFSIQTASGMAQVFYAGKDPEDTDGDSEEKPLFAFQRSEFHNGWLIGKITKRVNGVDVDKDEYFAVRDTAYQQEAVNADNYISANLDWLIEAVASDFDEQFPDAADEEFDDGE